MYDRLPLARTIKTGNFRKLNYFPKYSILLFLVIFTGLFFYYSYHNILFFRPQGLHQWRQSDCLSLTHNYYENGINFFKPSIHNLAGDGSGRTATDFPLIYFLVAQLWKIFGAKEYLYRLAVMLIMFTGLAMLFKTAEHLLKDSIWAMLLVLVLFSSPTLVFYTNNFLMDIPALGLIFVAWYFVYKFLSTQRNVNIYLALLFFLIAGLLKISALLSFIAFFIIYLYDLLCKKDGSATKLFPWGKKYLIPFLSVFFLIASWYVYAHFYNKHYNKGYFLIGILPVWDVSEDIFARMMDAIRYHIREDYFHPRLSLVLVFCWLTIVTFYKRINRLLIAMVLLTSFGMTLYLILFFQALESHDYYTINLMVLVPMVILTFLLLVKEQIPVVFGSIYTKIIVSGLLLFCFGFANTRMGYRYSDQGWENENRTKYTYAFETIEPYLESIGIKKEDTVICYPDPSINITLYLMNRKGWTSFNLHEDPELVAEKIRQGAKYLISYEKEGTDLDIFKTFLGPKTGRYKNVTIYSLKHAGTD